MRISSFCSMSLCKYTHRKGTLYLTLSSGKFKYVSWPFHCHCIEPFRWLTVRKRRHRDTHRAAKMVSPVKRSEWNGIRPTLTHAHRNYDSFDKETTRESFVNELLLWLSFGVNLRQMKFISGPKMLNAVYCLCRGRVALILFWTLAFSSLVITCLSVRSGHV